MTTAAQVFRDTSCMPLPEALCSVLVAAAKSSGTSELTTRIRKVRINSGGPEEYGITLSYPEVEGFSVTAVYDFFDCDSTLPFSSLRFCSKCTESLIA